jgi:chromosome segregation ATPase
VSNRNLSPKEQLLLQQLQELYSLCERTSQKMILLEQTLSAKDKELTSLRRDMVKLQEENQHQKEVLQTWRQRLESTLSQLNDLN